MKMAWQNWRTSKVWRYGLRDPRQAIQVESPTALLEDSDAERSGHQKKKELCFVILLRLMMSPQSGHCSYWLELSSPLASENNSVLFHGPVLRGTQHWRIVAAPQMETLTVRRHPPIGQSSALATITRFHSFIRFLSNEHSCSTY